MLNRRVQSGSRRLVQRERKSAMSEEVVNQAEQKTFRAHVWSPLNKGEAILEMKNGTRVEELLEVLSGLWGAQFKPDCGFGWFEGIIAGWCVLCKTTEGVFSPLGIQDIIPSTAPSSKLDYNRMDWFHQTMHRARHGEGRLKAQGFLTADAIAAAFGYRPSRHRSKSELPDGILPMHGGWPGDDEGFKVLMTGPEPTEPVDVRLAVIIAVSGT
jgi:hypothetical protein